MSSVIANERAATTVDVKPWSRHGVARAIKGARYDKLIEAFGGIGCNAATPAELTRALTEAIASGKPTLTNAVIDESAGAGSGRLTNLNPQSAAKK
jgi:oxalyl-CoA decarboxylase